MMYDVLYFYNQFVGPLPNTYEDFTKEWHEIFPATFDTKVLSFKSDYFGKTILGKIFEKCQGDKRLKDILAMDFGSGFDNYRGSELLSHYHEAAYDAYMTGYAFAKILKYKEIDERHHQKRIKKGRGKKDSDGWNATEKLPDPRDLHHTAINFDDIFCKSYLNKVMMNQFDNCACFGLNPDHPDRGAMSIEERQKEVVWIRFQDCYNVSEMSAETIASIFSDFGDFYVFKDQKQSVLLHFYYIDGSKVEEKSAGAFIELMNTAEMKALYKLEEVSRFSDAKKFVAHNHLE